MGYPRETEDFYFFAPLRSDLRSVHEKENLYLRGTWSKALERAIAESGVNEIFVQDWKGGDLSFLAQFAPQIKRLSIETPGVEDLSVINELRNLEELGVHHRSSVRGIEFSRFVKLRRCVLEVRADPGNIADCKNLQDLTLIGLKVDDLTGISDLKNLTSLALQDMPLKSLKGVDRLVNLRELLISAGSISSLTGLEHLKKLKCLTLSAMRTLGDLCAIGTVKSLEKLSVESCKKIGSFDFVREIASLQELHLTNVGKIGTLKPFSALKNLGRLTFWDDTNVLDGNISVILELPKLRVAGFKDRKHYSHTFEQVRQVLGSRLPA